MASVLNLCCADPSAVQPDVVARHVELARQRAAFSEVGRDFAAAMRSVIATAGYPHGPGTRRQGQLAE